MSEFEKQLTFCHEVQRLYHKNDPVTSKRAAVKALMNGALIRQQEFVWQAIQKHGNPDFTARELSQRANIDYYVIQRRLNEIEYKGFIERTGEVRNDGMVWRIKNGGSPA